MLSVLASGLLAVNDRYPRRCRCCRCHYRIIASADAVGSRAVDPREWGVSAGGDGLIAEAVAVALVGHGAQLDLHAPGVVGRRRSPH